MQLACLHRFLSVQWPASGLHKNSDSAVKLLQHKLVWHHSTAHLWIRGQSDTEGAGFDKVRTHNGILKCTHRLRLRCWGRRWALWHNCGPRNTGRPEGWETRPELHVSVRALIGVAIVLLNYVVIDHAEVASQLKRSRSLTSTTKRRSAAISRGCWCCTTTGTIKARQRTGSGGRSS